MFKVFYYSVNGYEERWIEDHHSTAQKADAYYEWLGQRLKFVVQVVDGETKLRMACSDKGDCLLLMQKLAEEMDGIEIC